MKKLSKIVSIILSLALCLGMASPAFTASFSELQGAIDSGESVEREDYAEGATGSDRYKIEASKDEETGAVNIKLWEKVERTEEEKGISNSGSEKDVTIDLNGSDIDGKGQSGSVISVSNGSELTIKDSTAAVDEEGSYTFGKITGGNGTSGGGVRVEKDSTLTLESGAISGNTVQSGGAVYGGGVSVTGGSSFAMNGGVIENNSANPGGNSSGGGVYVKNGSFTMTGNAQILDNTASNGGGIFLDNGSSFSMENSTVSGNHAVKGSGGGISVNSKGSEISISGSTISNNTAGHPESWGGFGGGISGNGSLTITDSKISGNTANSGGGIQNNESVTLKDTEVSGNIAQNVGGGVYNGGHFTVESGTVTGNTAGNFGGGIFNSNHLDVNGGSIANNQAGSGSGIYNQRGEWSPGELAISPDAEIADCVADDAKVFSHLGHVYKETVVRPDCVNEGSNTYTCTKCGYEYIENIAPLGHVPGEAVHENEVAAQAGVDGSYDLVVRCTVCGEILSSEHVTIPALPPEEPEIPENPEAPAIPDDGADDDDGYTPSTTVIEDQEVPLAGLLPVAQLLEELRQYAEVPEAELPEDFKWLDHEFAQAIYWGLQEELVSDTEETPFNPEEIVTVALLREVLVNFVERCMGLDDFAVTLEGEDDEMVMDLGARLDALYAGLETALADKAA